MFRTLVTLNCHIAPFGFAMVCQLQVLDTSTQWRKHQALFVLYSLKLMVTQFKHFSSNESGEPDFETKPFECFSEKLLPLCLAGNRLKKVCFHAICK